MTKSKIDGEKNSSDEYQGGPPKVASTGRKVFVCYSKIDVDENGYSTNTALPELIDYNTGERLVRRPPSKKLIVSIGADELSPNQNLNVSLTNQTLFYDNRKKLLTMTILT